MRKKLKESFRITPSKADKPNDSAKVANEDNRRGSTGVVPSNSTPRKQRSESSQSANSLQIFKKIIRKVSPAASPVNSDLEDEKSAHDTTPSTEKPKHKRKSFRKERHHRNQVADSDHSPFPGDEKSTSLPNSSSKLDICSLIRSFLFWHDLKYTLYCFMRICNLTVNSKESLYPTIIDGTGGPHKFVLLVLWYYSGTFLQWTPLFLEKRVCVEKSMSVIERFHCI